MASRSEIARQDQASEQRRTDACAKIIAHTRIDQGDWPDDDHHSGLASGVLSALIEAIEGERDDIIELRRKGWQTRAREQDAAIVTVKEWRDDLIAYKPPSTQALPQPAKIAVDHRAKTPEELDARLEAAFGIPTPVRHIRCALDPEPEDPPGDASKYGNLCGARDGSFTHPGGANCPDCHAAYAEQNDGKPYDGPTAHGTELPIIQIDGVDVTDDVAAVNVVTPAWSDGPVTPQVARAMREAGPRTTGAAGVIEHNQVGPVDAPDPEYKVGDTVTVAGIEFTKHSDWPPPMEGATLVEPTPFSEALNALKTSTHGIVGNETVPMPTIIEPAARRPARMRMTAAQVREHGLARQRGAEHRSVSQVQGHADCGTRAALSDMEIPAWWNVGGKAFHACAEEINRNADHLSTRITSPEDIEVLWLKHFDAQIVEQCAATPDHPISTWRAANKGSEHYDWWRVEGPVMVQKYVVWLSGMIAEGWRIAIAHTGYGNGEPVIEYSVNLDVGLQVPNLSIIDLALHNVESDAVLIVDLKAGSSAPKDTFQLGVYGWCALAAGIAQHPQQVRGAYYRARRGEMMAPMPVLDMHPWPDVVQRYRDHDLIERQGIYPPNVTNFCGGCGVRDLCPAQASS